MRAESSRSASQSSCPGGTRCQNGDGNRRSGCRRTPGAEPQAAAAREPRQEHDLALQSRRTRTARRGKPNTQYPLTSQTVPSRPRRAGRASRPGGRRSGISRRARPRRRRPRASTRTSPHTTLSRDAVVRRPARGASRPARGRRDGDELPGHGDRARRRARGGVFDAPERVRELHRRFAEAGSDLVLTCTFGATTPRLADGPLAGRAVELNAVPPRSRGRPSATTSSSPAR